MSDASPESRSRYEVITTLGQGGMARVLLTMSRGPAGVQKLLVVKELKDELKGDPEFVTMFLDEARIAARLNHPNVIQTYEVSSDGDHPLIVMEYLEGQSLAAIVGRVKRKNMPLDLYLHVLAQAAAGLHYAHDLKSFDGTPLGIVHRDVSPHNVFVTYDGLVKVVDFGIAKAADSAGVTRTGVFKGKVTYAAPEQLESKPVDRRSDVFALGVMLWEAIAHQRIASGESEMAVARRRCEGTDPKIREIAPDAPEELCALCEKAMALRPDDRFATAAEFRAAIDAYLESSRRIGQEQLGAFVREHFAEDREKVRRLVEAQVKTLRPSMSSIPSDAPREGVQETRITPSAQRLRGDAAAPASIPSSPTEPTLRAAETKVVPGEQATSSGKGRLFLIAAAFGIAALGAFQMLRGGSGVPASATGTSPTTAATSSAVAQPSTVNVLLSASPPEARLFIDGTALAGNPFRGALPRFAEARKLRVEAEGYLPEERLIMLDRDLQLELALKPVSTAAAVSSSAANAPPGTIAGLKMGGPTPGAQAVTPATSGPAPDKPPAPIAATPGATGTAAPKPTAAAPGEALTPAPTKTTRPIDDTF